MQWLGFSSKGGQSRPALLLLFANEQRPMHRALLVPRRRCRCACHPQRECSTAPCRQAWAGAQPLDTGPHGLHIAGIQFAFPQAGIPGQPNQQHVRVVGKPLTLAHSLLLYVPCPDACAHHPLLLSSGGGQGAASGCAAHSPVRGAGRHARLRLRRAVHGLHTVHRRYGGSGAGGGQVRAGLGGVDTCAEKSGQAQAEMTLRRATRQGMLVLCTLALRRWEVAWD